MVDLATEFDDLLNTDPPEPRIQEWLERHPIAFGAQYAAIAKTRLGSEYELDFILVQKITVNLTWTIVEIKRPDVRLFRQDGHMSQEVNAAISQVRDYQDWILKNLAYATRQFPGIFKPRACVHIGRRRSVSTEAQRQKLAQANAEGSFEVRTYDALLDNLARATDAHCILQDEFATAISDALPNLNRAVCLNLSRGEKPC